MIHTLMVKDSIYEGRYILSIREGKVYVKDTKLDRETELAVASADYFLSSGSISSSGILELKVNEVPEPLKINVRDFTKEHYISFDGKYGPLATDVPQQSEGGYHLTWSGSGWFLDEPQTIPNIPNTIQDLQDIGSGNITEGCLLIGSGNTEFKISNPRTISTSSSGYLRWNPSSGVYKLEDIMENITYSSGVLTISKTDTSTTDIAIDPISIYSSGLGPTVQAGDGDHMVWSQSSGQWVPATKLHTLVSGTTSSDLVSASGIANFTTTTVSNLLTGGSASLNLSTISASGITTDSIVTKTLTASSGIVSSGILDAETIQVDSLHVQTEIQLASGNLNLLDGDIISSGNITSSGIVTASGIVCGSVQTTTVQASGIVSSGMEAEFIKVTGSGKSIQYIEGTQLLILDFDHNNSYYYNHISLGESQTLDKLEFQNAVLGGQAIIAIHGTGSIAKTLQYVDSSAHFFLAPFEEDIVLSSTVEALLTVHYSRDVGGKPVYYVVVSALNLVS